MNTELKPGNYKGLIKDIGNILEEGRNNTFRAVNEILVKTYWEIGRRIVVFEQQGKEKAEYGSYLLERLSKDLKLRYGKGFSRSNISYMRLLYIKYQKSETLSHKLSWSHYFELLKVEEDLERSFYEQQCLNENWSVRELKRQINSALFYRLALSKNKKEVLKLSKKGQLIEKAEEKSNEDNEQIGIILSAKKDKIKVNYALGGISNKLFTSKYRFYLPNKKELENKLRKFFISQN